ncbi:hypothetical protein CRG98_002651 [Punica granatum]|uniref:Uncharacterized protein n=1 Tax=Punica granatum TaxID=22663 RepID=A0A2I0L8W4_PUNGR|nr:hypothetical protein CRG98_002651 [Punica granatum]
MLMLMKRRGVYSGLVVKGEEGALSMTTRVRSGNVSKGLPVNYCSGFRSVSTVSAIELDGVSRQNFSLEVNAKDYGFEPTETPRTDRSECAINYRSKEAQSSRDLTMIFSYICVRKRLAFAPLSWESHCDKEARVVYRDCIIFLKACGFRDNLLMN